MKKKSEGETVLAKQRQRVTRASHALVGQERLMATADQLMRKRRHRRRQEQYGRVKEQDFTTDDVSAHARELESPPLKRIKRRQQFGAMSSKPIQLLQRLYFIMCVVVPVRVVPWRFCCLLCVLCVLPFVLCCVQGTLLCDMLCSSLEICCPIVLHGAPALLRNQDMHSSAG